MYIIIYVRAYIIIPSQHTSTSKTNRCWFLKRSVLLKRVAQVARFAAAKRKPISYQLLIKLNLRWKLQQRSYPRTTPLGYLDKLIYYPQGAKRR